MNECEHEQPGDIDSEEEKVINEACPICNGFKTHFEISIRFWKCDSCSAFWTVGMNKTYFNELSYHKTSDKTQEKE